MPKQPRLILLFIIFLTAVAIVIDIPTIKIFGKTFSHPQIQTKYIFRDLEPKLGLDLAGGVQLTMSADLTGIDEADQLTAVESAKTVIENRINSLGVSEPVIQTAISNGQHRLIIELPGITDIDQAVSTVKKTAHLEFRTIKEDILVNATTSAEVSSYESTGLSGKHLKRAVAAPGQTSQDLSNTGYIVNLEFNDEGAQIFEEITSNYLQEPLAMFLDEEPISWPPPIIQSVISDGSAQITGNFSADTARELAIQLNAGALPIPLVIESQTRVGPSIGQESIDKSITAIVIGLVSVAVFMIAYYRMLGVVAVAALTIYTLLVYAVFKLIPVTLTLAGIAGFVLSIGMAVDANILIFERIKEELRNKRPKHDAFFTGFDRAWSSIRDSNVSSLITTVILFNFGTGPIRGFALTLAIGILISMFSAIIITKSFLRMFWIGKI